MANEGFIHSVKGIFGMYKMLGEKAIAQIDDTAFFWQQNEDSNSIALIIKHLWGNMLSRWTDFLTTDGEKPWRQRDAEFQNLGEDRAVIMQKWEEGWQRVFDTLNKLTDADLERIVYIRNEGHTVMEAINRQLAHYPYHVGQIVYIAKLHTGEAWKSLSIPRNKSAEYNDAKFAKEKERKFFTEGLNDNK